MCGIAGRSPGFARLQPRALLRPDVARVHTASAAGERAECLVLGARGRLSATGRCLRLGAHEPARAAVSHSLALGGSPCTSKRTTGALPRLRFKSLHGSRMMGCLRASGRRCSKRCSRTWKPPARTGRSRARRQVPTAQVRARSLAHASTPALSLSPPSRRLPRTLPAHLTCRRPPRGRGAPQQAQRRELPGLRPRAGARAPVAGRLCRRRRPGGRARRRKP